MILHPLANPAAHFKRSFSWGVKNAIYETSLTDAQWAYLKPMLPKPAKRGRPPTDRRRILDAILYVVKCGCPWRYLPTDFPRGKPFIISSGNGGSTTNGQSSTTPCARSCGEP